MASSNHDGSAHDDHQRVRASAGGGKDYQQPTSSAQLAGYRFVRKQLEQALVCADTRMVHDVPGSRRRALAIGVVLSVLGIAGAGIMAMMRPDPAIGDHTILIATDTGQMFVRVNDTLHPVTDLASARLVVGKAEEAHRVSSKNLASLSRGEFIGLRGPSDLPPQGNAESTERSWGVCHSPDNPRSSNKSRSEDGLRSGDNSRGQKMPSRAPGASSLVTKATHNEGESADDEGVDDVENDVEPGQNSRGTLSVAVAESMPRDARSAILRAESGMWLISPDSSDGHPYRRSLLAKRGSIPEPAVSRALGISSSTIRDVPDSFVEAIPRVDDVRTIRSSMPAGGDSGLRKPFNTIGIVIIADQHGSSVGRSTDSPSTHRQTVDNRPSHEFGATARDDAAADEGDVYVVRDHGLAPLAPVHARLLLSRPGVVVERVSPADISDIPTADELNWGTIPGEKPEWAPRDGRLCAGTVASPRKKQRTATADAEPSEAGDADILTWSEATSFPHGAVPVVQTEHAVAVGKREEERLIPRTADYYSGPAHAVAVDTGSEYAIVSSDGRRFAVDSLETLQILGFRTPTVAPWSVVRHLAEGESLSRDRASKIIVAAEQP
ncbi:MULTISPECIES: type VII secretion protein EccB [Corynebacterium]|uniref:type VII secretion protein EccB n=1 Tax=Corynebacterium TaxID=1716 RepID=UPI00264D331B|nr:MULTISPECIES: type VII secretion protein EccB [Corynebacterium]MDN8624177.1 type VII secretion protein EccB [Corynebacterium kroppenstedtii]